MATTMQKHTITAFYESRDYADRAAEKLRGLRHPDVRRHRLARHRPG